MFDFHLKYHDRLRLCFDFYQVNKIRHSMNSLLYTEPNQMHAINFDDVTKSKLMAVIRELTME